MRCVLDPFTQPLNVPPFSARRLTKRHSAHTGAGEKKRKKVKKDKKEHRQKKTKRTLIDVSLTTTDPPTHPPTRPPTSDPPTNPPRGRAGHRSCCAPVRARLRKTKTKRVMYVFQDCFLPLAAGGDDGRSPLLFLGCQHKHLGRVGAEPGSEANVQVWRQVNQERGATRGTTDAGGRRHASQE